ncbi:hypothetical protein [Maridesulfovibrio sp. FT414]|uniref:hypothetical protein n=1 Tax=Maridesulfovibrio sp. FT414 TaxID=2979469 RepID=UPI003D805CA0
MKKILSAAIVMACMLPSFSHATETGEPVKTYSFSKKKAPAEWSTGKTFLIADDRRLGLFNDRNKKYPSATTLTVSNIPQGSSVEISFDMIFVGSWDSEGKLADRFTVSIAGGPVLLDMTKFPCAVIDDDDNQPTGHDGFVRVGERDRAYWISPVSVEVPASLIINGEATVEFKGFLTGRKTEFWAIDNVTIKFR